MSEMKSVLPCYQTLTGDVGPIFDAYDVRLLVVPGMVGIVASIMCLSVSTGSFSCLRGIGVSDY